MSPRNKREKLSYLVSQKERHRNEKESRCIRLDTTEPSLIKKRCMRMLNFDS